MGTVTQFPTANEPEEVSLRIALHELGEGCGMDLTPEMPEIKPHVPALKALLKAYSEGFTVTINNLEEHQVEEDRKSTRLNSSHVRSSYAVFCLKKKRK